MAGYQLAADGSLEWLNQPLQTSTVSSTTITATPDYTNIGVLYACDVKTNVLGKSIKVETADGVLFHTLINDITSCDIISNRIIINTADEIPITLTFIDSIDAGIALNNIDIAMNGGYITCNDSVLNYNFTIQSYSGSAITYPGLIFADDILIGRVGSEIEVADKINSFAAPYYFVTFDGTNITLATYKKYLTHLPSTFKILSNYFGGSLIDNTETQINIENDTTSDFWVYDGINIIKNVNNNILYSFIFEIYYANDYMSSLTINSSSLSAISGLLPANLQKLYIQVSQLKNIDFVSNCISLKTLSVLNSSIQTVSNLNNLKQLNSITFENCLFTSLPSVNNLTQLLNITVKNTPLAAIPDLSANIKLVTLYFDGCRIGIFNPLSSSLKSFTLISDNISNFIFPATIALNSLVLNNNQIHNFNLNDAVNVTINLINLSNNKIDLSGSDIINLLNQINDSNSFGGTLDLTLNNLLGAPIEVSNTMPEISDDILTANSLTRDELIILINNLIAAIDNLKINKGWIVNF